MSRKQTFANNIRSLLAFKGLTRREAARSWEMKYDVLNRWSSAGLAHAHPGSADQLRKLATAFGFKEVDLLWTEWHSPLDSPDSPQSLANDVRDRLAKFSPADRIKAADLIGPLIFPPIDEWVALHDAAAAPAVTPSEIHGPAFVQQYEPNPLAKFRKK